MEKGRDFRFAGYGKMRGFSKAGSPIVDDIFKESYVLISDTNFELFKPFFIGCKLCAYDEEFFLDGADDSAQIFKL